jgi:hypothetical protein
MREQVIRHDAAMASPPHRLRTQDRDLLPLASGDQRGEAGSERAGLGVVGEVPERRMLPAVVRVAWR